MPPVDTNRALIAVTLALSTFCGCHHTSGSAVRATVVSREPVGCEKIGMVEGIGSRRESAALAARTEAGRQGGTHVVLEKATREMEDALYWEVPAKVFRCPADWIEPPPTGYPY